MKYCSIVERHERVIMRTGNETNWEREVVGSRSLLVLMEVAQLDSCGCTKLRTPMRHIHFLSNGLADNERHP